MSWIRKRLTPNKDEIKNEFIDIVRALSNNTPNAVKDTDQELANYRYHLKAAQDITNFKASIQGKLKNLKARHEEKRPNMLSGIMQYEEFIDLEIYTHQCL